VSGNTETVASKDVLSGAAVGDGVTPSASYNGLIAFICIAQLVMTNDTAVLSVILPSIARAFPSDTATVTWVAAANALTFASLLMLGGRLADLFGRKTCCLVGLALFGLGVAASASAPSAGMLIAARCLQGLGSAILAPANFSLLNTVLPAGPVRHRAFGIFGATQGFALIIGFVLGGGATSLFGWRTAFLVILPVVALAAALAWRYVPAAAAARTKQPVDVVGALLVVIGTGLLVLSFSTAGKSGWLSSGALAMLAAAVCAFGAFAFVESKTKAPLLPLSLFRVPNVAGANLAILCVMGASGGFFLLPNIYMQQVLHFSAARAGVAIIPQAVVGMATGRLVTFTMGRLSLRHISMIGMATFLLGLLGFLRLSANGDYFTDVLPPLVICAGGSILCAVVLAAAATADVPEARQGVASGLAFTTQQIGLGLGISIILTIVGSSHARGESLVASLHHGFFAAGVIAAVGLLAVILLMHRPPKTAPSSRTRSSHV
jgi:EmrB/QacA subfamily drug resistance transporter